MRSSFAVALGAAVGASGRWWIGDHIPSDAFPWPTLLVNVVGCAVIGWCAIRLERGTFAWYLVVTGLLGGFTTASAFAVETRDLVADGRPLLAAGYVAASIGLGLAAVSTTRTWAQRRVMR